MKLQMYELRVDGAKTCLMTSCLEGKGIASLIIASAWAGGNTFCSICIPTPDARDQQRVKIARSSESEKVDNHQEEDCHGGRC